MNKLISVIVPVFNRPDEMKELLDSLLNQSCKTFELIVVEDGSDISSEELCAAYEDKIDIHYFYKINEGPAIARNFGMEKARGDYMVFFDSDCIIPSDWMSIVQTELKKSAVDAFGGPDKASRHFNDTQKAVSYAMTSFFTTGGIRGNEKIDRYYPRSFNMGISKAIYEDLGGFPITNMHPGEDMLFSIELIKRGYRSVLIKDAFVYHKRRNTLASFYKQVFRFGKTRLPISLIYPETFKIFYVFPSAFVVGNIALILAAIIWHPLFLIPMLLYAILILIDSGLGNRSIRIGLLSALASYIQLSGYGLGFMKSWFDYCLRKKDEYGIINKKLFR